ncbi:AAA-like domain-containing protein [Geodermatophilus obscurus]|uniref:AAA-like domain-containing protein n=1 Tax=Geodermatophilus obscurus TaxID=1861 RepID=A0A1M7S4C6_9ACTN|nr:TraM recognition domain-containing protein [Geodermatophilus obscurus]SHN53165.1 AAA-like domain-containing protein [Geodermatophilus obscurus]
MDYDVTRTTDRSLSLSRNALLQTCLLFGGPGAGKTHLFKKMLEKALTHEPTPGCLLLDPKGVLAEWLPDYLRTIGRQDDLLLISPRDRDQHCNLLNLPLEPAHIGRLVAEVVMAEAGPIEPGWLVLTADLLESAAVVMAAAARLQLAKAKRDGKASPSAEPDRLTPNTLLRSVLHQVNLNIGKDRTVRSYLAHEWAKHILGLRRSSAAVDADETLAAARLDEFYTTTEANQRRYVRQAVEASFGELLRERWDWLSHPQAPNLYEGIHHNHKVVVVSIGQGSPAFQRSLCTLMKAGYQQTVLSSLTEGGTQSGRRRKGFSILACDEYAQVATEGRSGLVSDASFFSLSREAGCMALLALQSLATGRSRFDPTIRDRWEGILGNVGLRVFLRLNDLETAKLASEFVGRRKTLRQIATRGVSTDGTSVSESSVVLEAELAPPTVFTNDFGRGTALVQGTVDTTRPNIAEFVRVPA